MLMTSELIKVTKLLEENGIEVVSFKGPTLSQQAYGDITLRQYVDLDILIKEDDLKRTYNIFIQNNYDSKIENEYLNNELFRQKNSDIQFVSQKSNVLFEVHWKLFRSNFANKIDLKKTLYKSKICDLNGQNMKIFSNEVLLVYLCMHGSKHGWERIEWVVDIHKLVTFYKDIDWDKIYQLSKVLECFTMVVLGIHLSKKYFNTNIKTNKFQVQFTQMKSFEEETKKYWSEILKDTSEVEKNYKKFMYHYMLNDTFYLKLKFIICSLLTINERDILSSSHSNSYLGYYKSKVKRLISKYL